jgi:hypothetical protein
MKKKIIISFIIIFVIGIILFIINMLSSIGRKAYYRLESSNEFDSIGVYIDKEFMTHNLYFYNNRINIKNCIENRSDKKHTFPIKIGPIFNKKYFNELIAEKKVDSFYKIINKNLPHKQCFDTISINFWAIDSTNKKNKFVYDKTKKYPVIK